MLALLRYGAAAFDAATRYFEDVAAATTMRAFISPPARYAVDADACRYAAAADDCQPLLRHTLMSLFRAQALRC